LEIDLAPRGGRGPRRAGRAGSWRHRVAGGRGAGGRGQLCELVRGGLGGAGGRGTVRLLLGGICIFCGALDEETEDLGTKALVGHGTPNGCRSLAEAFPGIRPKGGQASGGDCGIGSRCSTYGFGTAKEASCAGFEELHSGSSWEWGWRPPQPRTR